MFKTVFLRLLALSLFFIFTAPASAHAPVLSVSPDSGFPGSSFTAQAGGFDPDRPGAMYWDGNESGTYFDSGGNASVGFTVRADMPPGQYSVLAICPTCQPPFGESASAFFTVLGAPPTDTPLPTDTATFPPPTFTFAPPTFTRVIPTATDTAQSQNTATPVVVASPTLVATASATASATPSTTATPSATLATPRRTVVRTATASATRTPTVSRTASPSATRAKVTSTPRPTSSAVPTFTLSAQPSVTLSPVLPGSLGVVSTPAPSPTSTSTSTPLPMDASSAISFSTCIGWLGSALMVFATLGFIFYLRRNSKSKEA